MKAAVMALSGGMDSSSLLLRLLRRVQRHGLSFDYGQKHVVELERASQLIDYLGQHGHKVHHHVADLRSATALFQSHLLSGGEEVPRGHYEGGEHEGDRRAQPKRNVCFIAVRNRSFGGRCPQHRRRGCFGCAQRRPRRLPDCRPEFYTALEHAFALGNWDSHRVSFTLPYLTTDKIGILKDAEESVERLDVDFDEVFARTITSYQPDEDGRSDGSTGSDVERILAFHAIGREDPLEYILPWHEVLERALETERQHLDQQYRERLTDLQYHVTGNPGQSVRLRGCIGTKNAKGAIVVYAAQRCCFSQP